MAFIENDFGEQIPKNVFPVFIADCRGRVMVAGTLHTKRERSHFNRDFGRYLGTGKITTFLKARLWL